MRHNGNFFSLFVFTVNFIGSMTYKLIEKADSSLCYVITVRYDIVYLTHMVQVFDETDIQFVCYFHIELLYSPQCLQCYHFAHEFDVTVLAVKGCGQFTLPLTANHFRLFSP